jgi:hypothetical protein
MRVGSPVGRLYHAPTGAKLSTAEIWDALKENRIKLPNTISIDSMGRVFLTPHQLSYTLSQRLVRADFERRDQWVGRAQLSSTGCKSGTRPRHSSSRRAQAFSRAARCI